GVDGFGVVVEGAVTVSPPFAYVEEGTGDTGTDVTGAGVEALVEVGAGEGAGEEVPGGGTAGAAARGGAVAGAAEGVLGDGLGPLSVAGAETFGAGEAVRSGVSVGG